MRGQNDPALARLFAQAASSFSQAWQRREPLLAHGGAARFEAVLGRGAFRDPRALFHRPGAQLTATVRDEDGALRSLPRVDGPHAAELYRRGATVHVDEVDRAVRCRRWRPFLAALAAAVGVSPSRLRCSGFAARGPGPGSPLHCDTKDIFVMQLVGTKRWSVGSNHQFPDPVENVLAWDPALAARLGRGLRQLELRPGSALFLPRGWWHATELLSQDCFSITIGFERPSWLEVLGKSLHNRLRRRAAWRAPVDLAWGDEPQRRAHRARFGELLVELSRELAAVDPDELFADASATADAFGYFRAPGVAARLARARGGWQLWVGRRAAFRLDGARQRALVRWVLARRGDFTAADAAQGCGLEPAVATAVLDRLTAAGVLKPLPIVCRPVSL